MFLLKSARAGVLVTICLGLVADEPASFLVGTNAPRDPTHLPISHRLRPYKKVHWGRRLVPCSEFFAIAHIFIAQTKLSRAPVRGDGRYPKPAVRV